MADIPVPFGGSGGTGDSSDCTATAEDVLESKTAIYDGSNDEPAYGSMKDYSGTTQSATASLDESNSRVQLAVPNTGKYDTAAKLYTGYSNFASLIGLTADKIASNASVLGIDGTYRGHLITDTNIWNGATGQAIGTATGDLDQAYQTVRFTFNQDCVIAGYNRIQIDGNFSPGVTRFSLYVQGALVNSFTWDYDGSDHFDISFLRRISSGDYFTIYTGADGGNIMGHTYFDDYGDYDG